MNYLITIAKIIHIDYYLYHNDNIADIYWIELYGKLSDQLGIIKIIVWGNHLKDVLTYYSVEDYVLIEGYINFNFNFESKSNLKKLKCLATVNIQKISHY